jgi:predicted phage terminase large subunit-like protein
MAQPLRINLDDVEAELASRSLPDFILKAWPLVEPDVPLCWNWHLDELCRVLEQVTRGELTRVIVNIPPGTAKSLIVSVFWPAWEWASNPGLRYLTASYGAHLTIRDNLRLRGIINSSWYQRHYALRLSGDQNSKIRFDTTAGGWRIATSVGGVGTGEHPDRIVIDDPLTATQARSETERSTANLWLDRTISSRGIVRGVRVVVVMQRLHEEDPSGHLLAKGGYEHVMFPMHFDPKRADKRDQRTVAGELLWPALFTPEMVRKLEIDLGPYGAAGQLEQAPSPEGGGLFQRSWFGVPVEAAPVIARRVRGWDTAGTEGGGDWTVGAKLAEIDGIVYVEDVVRAQVGPGKVNELFLQTAALDSKACAQREEREGGASGKAVIAARAKLLAGYDYREVPASGDKVTRAKPFRAQCEAGNVKLVKGEWNEQYLQELEAFPTAKHDDQVDASSAAYNALVAEAPPRKRSLTW